MTEDDGGADTGPVQVLAEAVQTYDRDSAASACDELVTGLRTKPGRFSGADVDAALGSLRSIRAFDLMLGLGDAAIVGSVASPRTHRQYAQALIETGRSAAAEAVLLQLLDRTDLADEAAEVKGLLGRTYKQRYVDIDIPNADGAARSIQKSIDAYLSVYEDDPTKTWHGINAVAMLARGRRDGVSVEGPDHNATARQILDHLAPQWLAGSAPAWDAATAMEAAVALGDLAEAREWLVRYTSSPLIDGFALASTTRQLVEVWQIDPESPMGELIQVLRANTMERGDGAPVEVTALADPHPFEQRTGGLEKTFGQTGAVTLRWWMQAQERLGAVARIEDASGGPIGTGFVVNGNDLSDAWDDGMVLVTNAHVIGETFSRATPPDEAWANFTLTDPDNLHKVGEVLFESDPTELDCTVVRLESLPDNVVPLPLATRLPAADGTQRLYVMGHPLGGGLKISIDDNVLIDHDDHKVHYRAPTEPGSSGSPVFNRTWHVVALHHSGNDRMEKLNGNKGTYQANEGIAFASIRGRIAPPT